LGFSQFKLRLSEWQKASGRGLSMRQVHHAGETVQVDYAGVSMPVEISPEVPVENSPLRCCSG
jgi:hypothetical protein